MVNILKVIVIYVKYITLIATFDVQLTKLLITIITFIGITNKLYVKFQKYCDTFKHLISIFTIYIDVYSIFNDYST